MFDSTLATLAPMCTWTMITCTIQISHFREKKGKRYCNLVTVKRVCICCLAFFGVTVVVS